MLFSQLFLLGKQPNHLQSDPKVQRSNILMMFVSGGPDSCCYEPMYSICLLIAKTSSPCTSHITIFLQENLTIMKSNCDTQCVNWSWKSNVSSESRKKINSERLSKTHVHYFTPYVLITLLFSKESFNLHFFFHSFFLGEIIRFC